MSRCRTITVYLIFGPLIGSLIFGIVVNIIVAMSGSYKADMLKLILYFIPFGYVIGGIPAGLTGVTMAYYENRKEQYELIKIAFMSGLLSTLVCGLALGLFKTNDFDHLYNFLMLFLVLGVLGGVSAFLIAKVKYRH